MMPTTITRTSIIASNGVIALLFLGILVFSLINLIEFIRILKADAEEYYQFNKTLILFLIIGNTIIAAISLIYVVLFAVAVIQKKSIDFYDIIQKYKLPGLDKFRKALSIKEELATKPDISTINIPDITAQKQAPFKKLVEKVSTCPIDAKPALPALAQKPLQIDIKSLQPTGQTVPLPALYGSGKTSLDLQTLRKEYFNRSKLL